MLKIVVVSIMLLLSVGCKESAPINKEGASESTTRLPEVGGPFFIYGYGFATDTYEGVARQKSFQIAQVYARISQFVYAPGGAIEMRLRKKAGVVMNNSGGEFPAGTNAFFRTHTVQFLMHPDIYKALPTNPHRPAFSKEFQFNMSHAPAPAELFKETIRDYVVSLGAENRQIEADIFFSKMDIIDSATAKVVASIY